MEVSTGLGTEATPNGGPGTVDTGGLYIGPGPVGGLTLVLPADGPVGGLMLVLPADGPVGGLTLVPPADGPGGGLTLVLPPDCGCERIGTLEVGCTTVSGRVPRF